MEAAAIVGELQVHEVVQLRERQSTDLTEMPGDHLLREVRQQCINGYQIDASRLSARNEVHLAEPGMNELLEGELVHVADHDAEDLVEEPVLVSNDNAVDESNQVCEKA